MRILGALDSNIYSYRALEDLANLCANTWADVTLLMLAEEKPKQIKNEDVLISLAQKFVEKTGGDQGPYHLPDNVNFRLQSDGSKTFVSPGKKELILRIRTGDYAKEILEEAREIDSDLIVLGCSKGMECEWEGILGLPKQIARDATCSVLVIKDTTRPSQIISFLDQSNVSQESLELINQMVTIHHAGLKIVGLMGEKGIVEKEDVQRKMLDIISYYNEKGIHAWITFIEKSSIEDYVANATHEGMVALWIGKKSFFSRIFSRDLLGKLIEYARSSILILR